VNYGTTGFGRCTNCDGQQKLLITPHNVPNDSRCLCVTCLVSLIPKPGEVETSDREKHRRARAKIHVMFDKRAASKRRKRLAPPRPKLGRMLKPKGGPPRGV